MASIQKEPKTASLLLEAPTTSLIPLSSGEETIPTKALLSLVSCTWNSSHFFFPTVCQSWARKEQVAFEDPSSSIRRRTVVYEKSTVEPRSGWWSSQSETLLRERRSPWTTA